MLLRDSLVNGVCSPGSSCWEDISKNLGWNGSQYTNDLMLQHGDKLQFRVMSMLPKDSKQHNFLNGRADACRSSFDLLPGDEHDGIRRSDLALFTANECYVFYVHGSVALSSWQEAVSGAYTRTAACLHRRMEDGTAQDVRVTITANQSFFAKGADEAPKKSGLEKFITAEYLAKFAVLFNDRDLDPKWQPLSGTPWSPVRKLLKAMPRIRAGESVREIDWNKVE